MGGGSQAPTPYQPANQAGADSAYTSTLGGLTAQNQANQQAIDTGYGAAYSTIANNPYVNPMIQGTIAAANTTGQVGANAMTQGQVITDQAGQIFNDANTVRGYAPQFQNLATTAAGYATPLAASADSLRSYAPELMELGLDPNMSEYNFGLQGAKDSQNIANAEAGISGSPFAAGATGDAMAAYKRNWDAARFGRAQQALAALGQLYDSAGNLNMEALSALQASGGFLGDAANMFTTAAGMDTAGTNIDTAGIGLQQQGAEDQALAAAMPYEAVNTVGQDQMAALGQMATGEATAAAPVAGNVDQYGNYLNIGQNATQIADRAAQINYQDSFLGGLGQLLGVAGQIGAHFIPGYQ